MLSLFWAYGRKQLGIRIREGDHARLSSVYIKDKNGILLRDVELVRKQRVRWLHTLVNAKTPKLEPNLAESLGHWPESIPLDI